MTRAIAIRLLCLLLTLSLFQAMAQFQQPPVDAACVALHQKVNAEVANGRPMQAEALLSEALAHAVSRAENACAGLALHDMAALMAVSGRLGEAERFAERSIHVLEENYPRDHPVFLRPLHIVASVRFEHGEMGRAREAFKRMETIRIERPEDRAILCGISGALLSAEGRYREAESEYLLALDAWQQAGRGSMADTGTLLNALGSIYIREHRLDDARRVLDRARDIFMSAKDAVPMDRFKLLDVRGVMHVQREEWREAEQDLGDAVSMADRLPGLDPGVLTRVFADYAYVLRKNHRRREARSVEARAAVLRRQSITNTVIDATELRAQSKRSKQ